MALAGLGVKGRHFFLRRVVKKECRIDGKREIFPHRISEPEISRQPGAQNAEEWQSNRITRACNIFKISVCMPAADLSA